MRIIFFLLLLAIVNKAGAQSLLISMNFGDCVKCSIKLNQLRPEITGIPTFIVLDESNLSDKAEIEEKYEFGKLGIQTVYSNELDKRLRTNASTVTLLGPDDKVLFQQLLFNLAPDEIEKIKSLYAENYLFTFDRRYVSNFKNGVLYGYNHTLDILRAVTIATKDTLKYKMTPEYAEKGMEAVFHDYKKNKKEYAYLYETQPSLKPVFSMYNLYKNYTYMLAKFYYMERNTKKGELPYVWYKYALYKFDKDVLKSVTALEIPPLDTATFDDGFFVVKNENAVLFSYYPSAKPQPGKYNPFIGQFDLKDGKYKFSRWLKIDLPDVYKETVGNNYNSFRIVDYPFFTLNLSQEIADIEQETSHAFKLPVALDFSKMKYDGKRPLDNDYIFHDEKNRKVYILGIIQGKWHITGVSTQTWQLVDFIDLNAKISKITDQCRFLHMNFETGQLYATDTDGFVRSYPLALVFAR